MKEHQEMVRVLVKSGAQIKEELTPNDCHLWHMASCIGSEAGELFDAIKKRVVYRKDLDINNVIEELGDLEFYLEGTRQSLGITREQCLEANMQKLAKRYEGFKYSDAQAQARNDKK